MDSLEDQLFRAFRERQSYEETGREERYRAASRERLLRILRRKTQTAFIGSIAAFEAHFGFLWGHGKPTSLLTPDQLRWRELWERCRNSVLNNGNNQVRAVEAEVGQYSIVWERHSATIPVAEGDGRVSRGNH